MIKKEIYLLTINSEEVSGKNVDTVCSLFGKSCPLFIPIFMLSLLLCFPIPFIISRESVCLDRDLKPGPPAFHANMPLIH